MRMAGYLPEAIAELLPHVSPSGTAPHPEDSAHLRSRLLLAQLLFKGKRTEEALQENFPPAVWRAQSEATWGARQREEEELHELRTEAGVVSLRVFTFSLTPSPSSS